MHAHGHASSPGLPQDLTRYAWLAIATALATMGLKAGAYLATGSVGLLSDALESTVNLTAGVVALIVLRVAHRPADENHPFGHGKAEYFSATLEGMMIIVAAVAIIWTAIPRLISPRELDRVDLGLGVSLLATALNVAVATILIRAGKRHSSITLEADGRHLLTDVWTSLGVVCAVIVVAFTGWQRLDPVIAIAVALGIVITGSGLIRRSVAGLMDAALPDDELGQVSGVLDRHTDDFVSFHRLRTRRGAGHRFVEMHMTVPGTWTVRHAHDLADQVEAEIEALWPRTDVLTHVEPAEAHDQQRHE